MEDKTREGFARYWDSLAQAAYVSPFDRMTYFGAERNGVNKIFCDGYQAATLEAEGRYKPVVEKLVGALDDAADAIEQWGIMSARKAEQREQLSDDIQAIDKALSLAKQLLGEGL